MYIVETPFSELKATEMDSRRLEELFVEPLHIDKLKTNTVAFIEGARGTGKTTVIRHLCDLYNVNDGNPKDKLGIYYRFEPNKMTSFYGSLLSDDQWKKLFEHCFSIEMCLAITSILLELKEQYDFQYEREICKSVSRHFFDDEMKICSSFSELKESLSCVLFKAKKYLRNPMRFTEPMYGDNEKSFEDYCILLRKESFFCSLCVHFFLDEYENMLDFQKKYINSCVKNADFTHIFKICVRPNGLDDMATLKESEVLNNPDDYKIINYANEILGNNDGKTKEFMVSVCNRRLQKYYVNNCIDFSEDDIQIEKCFSDHRSYDAILDELSSDSSYMESVKDEVSTVFRNAGLKYKYQWTLLQLKIFLTISKKRVFDVNHTINSIETKNEKYHNWLNNYKRSVVLLCCEEQNRPFPLSGFEDVLAVSGNVLRYVLEICDECFMYSKENNRFKQISSEVQTAATYRVSDRRFKQISTIPVFGQSIKQLVLAIGSIFRMYNKDEKIQRFETNHFSIDFKKTTGKLAENSKFVKALNASVINGVFIVEPSNKKTDWTAISFDDSDFFIHPILTSYFHISWRKKQKCRFSYDEIDTLLFGKNDEIDSILKQYRKKITMLVNGSDDSQLSFSDLKYESF